MENKYWIDSHCHLADPGLSSDLDQELLDVSEENIRILVSSVLSKAEISWQQEILPTLKIPDNIKIHTTAGIHPFYEFSNESDFDHIADLAAKGRLIGIGEIGLDKRNPNVAWQKDLLLKQLDLARSFDLPVVFHVVKMHYLLYKILKNNFPKVRGYFHGFNSSLEIAEEFGNFDLAFSMNIRTPKPDVLNFILSRGFYLIETDAPYAKPFDNKDDRNHLKNLKLVYRKINEQTGISIDDIQTGQFESFRKLFPNTII